MVAQEEREMMMFAKISTRDLQYCLHLEQVYLGREKNEEMREIRKAYIVDLAKELLYRFREESKKECLTH
jgi:hypothetical protein